MTLNLRITLAVYAIGLLCQLHLIPWFTMPLTLITVFSRWAFSIHTRTHFKGRYPVIEEMMLLVMSPLSIGLSEQRLLHEAHHRHLGTTLDPDSLFYNAHPIVSLFLCFWQPEIMFCRCFPAMSIGAKSGASIRAILFLALAWLGGWYFALWYLLPLRILFGAAQFTFTYVLHHRREDRTIDLVLPQWSRLFLGETGYKELTSHIRHHR